MRRAALRDKGGTTNSLELVEPRGGVIIEATLIECVAQLAGRPRVPRVPRVP